VTNPTVAVATERALQWADTMRGHQEADGTCYAHTAAGQPAPGHTGPGHTGPGHTAAAPVIGAVSAYLRE
jgi:hypothetical protein